MERDRLKLIVRNLKLLVEALESEVYSNVEAYKAENFDDLPENFKRLFTDDDQDQNMKLPIVGYGGHRKGEKAENMFAKNYRDTTI